MYSSYKIMVLLLDDKTFFLYFYVALFNSQLTNLTMKELKLYLTPHYM